MKVSIITAVYNNEKNIGGALGSLSCQTYKNIESIIIDGGSADGTVEIVRNHGSNISKLISEKDGGIYDALNKGIGLATGDIIGFLHSDDVYPDSNVIRAVADGFAGGEFDGVYGDLVYTYRDDTEKTIRYWKSRDYEPGLLRKGWMPPHPTLFLKKEVYEKFGKFDTGFEIAADYDFILRILRGGIKVKYIPRLLYKMRVGGISNKSIGNIIGKSSEDLRALRKNGVGGIGTLVLKNISKISQFIGK